MKKTHLLELSISPEDYDLQHYEKVDYCKLHSLMTAHERRFVSGLIRYYEPQNIIEIGVNRGGGTVNLLNAISDFHQSKVISIDCSTECSRDIPIGNDVETYFSEYDKWELYTGKDPSCVVDELPYKYDFAVIDTAHFHPIESLNFLCVLPHLNDGAIVVLHDVALHLIYSNNSYAPRILMSSVVAPKITPTNPLFEVSHYIPNIVAFQVNSDTRKYIDNVFDSLLLPWGFFPRNNIESVGQFLKKHYTISQVKKYYKAAYYNFFWIQSKSKSFDTRYSKASLEMISDEVIFYGAGHYFRAILNDFQKNQITFPFPVWDINAERIDNVFGIPVSKPDFKSKASGNQCLIITIHEPDIAMKVKSQFECLGYNIFFGLNDYIQKVVYHKMMNDFHSVDDLFIKTVLHEIAMSHFE